MSKRKQLEQAIAHLESQRDMLGDAAVDAALVGLRQKLAEMDHMDVQGPGAPKAAVLAGERKLVTVMFADISGFTAMAETMDPEAVRDIMNGCFEQLVPIMEKYEGTVDKFIGDEIMALFGAPVAHENDPERALRAALAMMIALTQFNTEQGTDLGLHFGINTGLVIAGGIGTDERQEYSVMGDAVNLAARLRDASDRGEIFVGPDTYRLTAPLFTFETLEPIRVKGKVKPVQIYSLMDLKAEPGRVRGLETRGISSPLVGRDPELASIKGCIERLLNGRGGIVSVIGEAGVGKSRLMAEIRSQVPGATAESQTPNLTWLEGHALSFGQTISYWPFQEILWQYAGIAEDDSEAIAWHKLESRITTLFVEQTPEILPYLATLLTLEMREEYAEQIKLLDSEAMGRQIFLASRRFFERLAQVQPLVMVFEDLHWVDESSASLLEHLLPLVEQLPLLICGISRPEPQTQAKPLRELASQNFPEHHTQVRLVRLSPQASTQLVANLLDISGLSPAMREMIVHKSEGNPFFLEEIIRSLIDAGAAVRDPATGHWQATDQVETIVLPDTIQGIIMARVDRLTQEVKQVLRMAAVIGRSFLYRVLHAIAEMDQELDQHLAELQALELIREKQRLPELEYIFKHVLVQEATYESVLLQKRRELHIQVGQAIETLFADRLEEFYGLLAYHYARAEAWEKAHEYLFKAGDQAGRMAADAEALAHYQQALAAHEHVFGNQWDPLQRATLERKIGEALYRRGENTQAFESLQQALTYLGHSLPASPWGVRLKILREFVQQIGHRLLPGLFLKQGDEPVNQDVAELGRIYESLIGIALGINQEQFLLIALRTLNFSERSHFVPGAVLGFATLSIIADFATISRLAEYYGQKAVDLAEQIQHPSVSAVAFASWAVHLNSQGRWHEVLEYAQRGVDLQRKGGYWNMLGRAFAATTVADGHVHLGNFTQALACAQETVLLGRDSGDRLSECAGLSRQGFAQRGLGQLEEAVDSLQKAMEISKSIPNYLVYVDSGGELGQCYVQLGELEQAFTVFEECRRASIEQNLMKSPVITRFREGLAEAYLLAAKRADPSEKADWLKKAGRACQDALKQGKAYLPGMPRAMMLRGQYEWLRGKHTAAKKWWQRSLTLAEEMNVRYEVGRTLLDMGKRLDEPRYLELAETVFTETESAWELARVSELIDRDGGQ